MRRHLTVLPVSVLLVLPIAIVSARADDLKGAEQMTNFKKAFSVCLEAKSYMVKY